MSFWDRVKAAKDATTSKINDVRAEAEARRLQREAEEDAKLRVKEEELTRLQKKLELRQRVQRQEQRIRDLEAETTTRGRIVSGVGKLVSKAVESGAKRRAGKT